MSTTRRWPALSEHEPRRGRGVSAGMAGFSFVDILMTVAITGIVLATAVPQIGTALIDARANATLRAVQGHLRASRDDAIGQRRIVAVDFSGSGTIVSTRLETAADRVIQTTVLENGMSFQLTPGVPDTPDLLGASRPVSFGGETRVYFQPDGSLTDRSNLPISGTLFLGSPRILSARAVTVMGPTGRVTGYRWDSRAWRQL